MSIYAEMRSEIAGSGVSLAPGILLACPPLLLLSLGTSGLVYSPLKHNVHANAFL